MKYLLYSFFGVALTVLFSTSGLTQENQTGDMQLLPGYQYRPIQGIDSVVGEFVKPNGLRIAYEKGLVQNPREIRIGGGFTDRPLLLKNSDQIRWYREQTVNAQPIHLAYRNDDWLLVSVPQQGVNFAVLVRDANEMAEALLMIMTYPSAGSSKTGLRGQGTSRAPDPTAIRLTVKSGSYLAVESLVVVDGVRRMKAWEVFQVNADFDVRLFAAPVATNGEPIVKFCEKQIWELMHIGDVKNESTLGTSGSKERGDGYTKEPLATYLFEGQWVSEGGVQKYVPSGQFKIGLIKPARFKYRKSISWSPDQ